jgi:tetratricopeptide (TPR) repeat protein
MQVYYYQGDFAKAEPLFAERLQALRRAEGERSVAALVGLRDLADVYAKRGRYDEAEPMFRQALAGLKGRPADDPVVLQTEHLLAMMYLAQGKPALAEPFLVKNLDLERARPGKDRPALAAALSRLGQSYVQQGKCAAAEPLLRGCLAIRDRTMPDRWLRFYTRGLLGASLAGQKKFAAAEPLLLSGYEGMKARPMPTHAQPRLAEAVERIIQPYEAWGKKAEANRWRKRRAGRAGKAPPPS